MVKSPQFETLYKVLNKAQEKAVDTIEGPVMVIAGPGTGKTTVLTLRIANILLKTDTAPENILALTFTESGAFAMRRKLLEIIGPAAYKMNIHTFHGFSEHIIQKYPDYFPRIIGSAIITEVEQITIIEKLIQSRDIKILRPYGDPSYYIKSVLHEIHILKRENISPADFKVSVKADGLRSVEKSGEKISVTELEKLNKRNEKNLELASIYARYEEELAKHKYYDFDDMLLELIRAMEENDTFKLMLQETYQYILADEHQDANASQNRILELLADFHDSPNLFIVGDDKQAIYRFQGASLDNFLFFSKKYADAVVVDLEHNYRSHQGILDASHSVILNNPFIPGHSVVRLTSLQIGTKPIYVDEFADNFEELEHLAILIEQLIHKGEKPEEIAILYRENKDARPISDILRAHNIQHRIESDRNILGDIDIAKIIMLCQAIHDPSNDEFLGQALLLPEIGCDSADVAEVCNLARREKKPLHRVIRSLAARNMCRDAYDKIISWSHEAQTLSFLDFLQKLIQQTNMLGSIVSAPNSLERLASLEAFFDRIVRAAESKNTFYLKEFMEYVGIIKEHGIMAKNNYADHVAGVRLMTAHRAKGLEFNHVFIVHAVDGSWGNRSHRNHFSIPVIEHVRDTGRIEDERRLFYVAMTRARESVSISYARSNGEKDTVQCQFIAEIDPKLIIFDKPVAVAGSRQDAFVKKTETPASSNAVSILNPDFVRSKFLAQPFSVTHLNNYLKCSWEYFFVNLIRVPQAPSKHQMYGTAIHVTLRSFFEAYKEERDFSKKQLIDLFKHNLEKQPMSADERSDSFDKGKRALKGYLKTYESTWGRNLLTEYAVKGVEMIIKMPEIVEDPSADIDVKKSSDDERGTARLELTGKLDKIELLNDREVIVTDFKTAKPKSRNEIEGKTKNADGNYKRQLVFYRLLLDGARDVGGAEKFNMKYGELDFVEPNERGIYKKERFEITQEETKELRNLIEKTAKEIISLAFRDTLCDDKDCPYCRLGKILTA